MSRQTSLQPWLDVLPSLQPVRGLVVVGAGGADELSWPVGTTASPVLLVEADREQLDDLKALAASRPGWSVHGALVGEHEGELDFHCASNPHESGLIRPESLTGIWRHLKTVESRPMRSTTLQALLPVVAPEGTVFNWLVIHCLPALPVLRGAGALLAAVDVVLARVVLQPEVLPGQGATKAELDEVAEAAGFRCLCVVEERHPAIGKAVYVRDWQAAARTLEQRLQSATQQVTALLAQAAELPELHAAHDEARAARDGASRLADERQAEIQSLRAEARRAEEAHAAAQAEATATLRQAEQQAESRAAMLGQAESRIQALAAELAGALAARGEADQELAALRERVGRSEQALAAMTAALEAERVATQGLRQQLQDTEAQAAAQAEEARSAAETAAQTVARLTDSRDEYSRLHQENAKWAQSLKAANEALAGELAAAKHSIQVLTDAATGQAARCEELQQALQSERTESAARAAARDALGQELAASRERESQAARALQAERAALDELRSQFEALKVRAAAHARAAEAAEESVARLTQERDEHKRWHLENAQWAQKLKASNDALATELAEAKDSIQALTDGAAQGAAQIGQLQQTVQAMSAEAATQLAARAELEQQLAASRERENQSAQALQAATAALQSETAALAALKPHVDELQARAAAQAEAAGAAQALIAQLTQQRDEQKRWHHENAQWAQKLKGENEALARELADCRATIDGLNKKLADSEAARAAASRQVADRDARQQLLDIEILKAEAQLELVKDVLLREPKF